jgi:hypothetical protein
VTEDGDGGEESEWMNESSCIFISSIAIFGSSVAWNMLPYEYVK